VRVAGLSLILVACAAPPWARVVDDARPLSVANPAATSSARVRGWADVTQSPWRTNVTTPLACGSADAALGRVAQRIADDRARGLGSPEPDTVVSWMRANGEPHPRPVVLVAAGKAPLETAALRAKIDAVRTARMRCGFASASLPHGGELMTAVLVDPLADLAPLPTRAHTGAWLTFEARLLVPADDARVVLLGPRGAPRDVPTSFDRDRGIVRARFALDRPGAFTVQLVGDLASGPRPLLEARIFADAEPPADSDPPALVPGEEAGHDDLASMIDALRRAESLPVLERDRRLDAIAGAYAARMRDTRSVAHDLGEGDLRSRFAEAGLDAHVVGENVARGATLVHVHRAVYASPSHRANLLSRAYTHVGIGLARADDGTVYACEVFAGALH
jgi:hypothetical protein